MEGIEDIMIAITGGDPTGGDSIPEDPVETGSGADDLLSGIANALSGEA